MITLKNINIQFDKPIVKGEEISFEYGKITGITGPSGSGKSCLLDIVALQRNKFEYTYDYNGKRVEDLEKFKNDHIVYVSQKNNYVDDLNCRQHIQLLVQDQEISEALLKEYNIDFNLDVYPNTLSDGQRQRFSLLLAYLSQGDIIVLDEITASLDHENSVLIGNLLKKWASKENRTIILATHDSLLIDLCDDLYTIQEGELIHTKRSSIKEEETPKEVKDNKKRIVHDLIKPTYHQFKNKKITLLILTAILISLSMVGLQIGIYHQRELDNIYSTINQNQNFVVKNNEWYELNNDPVYDEGIENFFIENDYTYYPFGAFIISNNYKDASVYFGDATDEEELTQDGQFLFEYTLIQGNDSQVITENINPEEDTTYAIFPYFDESHLEQRSTQVIDGDGVYLSAEFAARLGLDELTDETYVQLKYLVPVVTEYKTVIDTETNQMLYPFDYENFNGLNVKQSPYDVFYEVVEGGFKVKGILDKQVQQIAYAYLFYMDHEMFDEILAEHQYSFENNKLTLTFNDPNDIPDTINSIRGSQAYAASLSGFMREQLIFSQNASFTLELTPYQANAYTIFTPAAVTTESLQESMTNINSDYYIFNIADKLSQTTPPALALDNYYNAFGGVLLVFVLIFSIVMNHMNKKKKTEEYEALTHLRFTLKDLKEYVTKDLMIKIILTAAISLIGIGILNLIALQNGYLAFGQGYNESLMIVGISAIGISLVMMVIQTISSYRLVKDYDSNRKY